jgi:hypothetical protein
MRRCHKPWLIETCGLALLWQILSATGFPNFWAGGGETNWPLKVTTAPLGVTPQRCSVWSSRTNGVSACELSIVSCGPISRSCSARGAVDSPRLLMLPGIDPAEDLRSLGIPVAIDLPDVGRHLEDHLLVAGVAYKARREVPRSRYNHADALLYVPQSTPDASPELLVMCLSLPFVLPTVGPACFAGGRPRALPDAAPQLGQRETCFRQPACSDPQRNWVAQHPGSRPYAWWRFIAPEERGENESEAAYLDAYAYGPRVSVVVTAKITRGAGGVRMRSGADRVADYRRRQRKGLLQLTLEWTKSKSPNSCSPHVYWPTRIRMTEGRSSAPWSACSNCSLT